MMLLSILLVELSICWVILCVFVIAVSLLDEDDKLFLRLRRIDGFLVLDRFVESDCSEYREGTSYTIKLSGNSSSDKKSIELRFSGELVDNLSSVFWAR